MGLSDQIKAGKASGKLRTQSDDERAQGRTPYKGDPVTSAEVAKRKNSAKGAAPKQRRDSQRVNVGHNGTTKGKEDGDGILSIRKGGGEMPYFDASTRDGRRSRLEWMVNHGENNQARQAVTTLNAMDLEDAKSNADPNAAADPAEVCAFLARANLYGDNPADVLIKTHGLRKVARALLDSLGFDRILVEMGGDMVDIGADKPVLQGDSTDIQSVGE
jgi:hypothetical protein